MIKFCFIIFKSVSGFISVLVRQTNILWVFLFALDSITDVIKAEAISKRKIISPDLETKMEYLEVGNINYLLIVTVKLYLKGPEKLINLRRFERISVILCASEKDLNPSFMKPSYVGLYTIS